MKSGVLVSYVQRERDGAHQPRHHSPGCSHLIGCGPTSEDAKYEAGREINDAEKYRRAKPRSLSAGRLEGRPRGGWGSGRVHAVPNLSRLVCDVWDEDSHFSS